MINASGINTRAVNAGAGAAATVYTQGVSASLTTSTTRAAATQRRQAVSAESTAGSVLGGVKGVRREVLAAVTGVGQVLRRIGQTARASHPLTTTLRRASIPQALVGGVAGVTDVVRSGLQALGGGLTFGASLARRSAPIRAAGITFAAGVAGISARVRTLTAATGGSTTLARYMQRRGAASLLSTAGTAARREFRRAASAALSIGATYARRGVRPLYRSMAGATQTSQQGRRVLEGGVTFARQVRRQGAPRKTAVTVGAAQIGRRGSTSTYAQLSGVAMLLPQYGRRLAAAVYATRTMVTTFIAAITGWSQLIGVQVTLQSRYEAEVGLGHPDVTLRLGG